MKFPRVTEVLPSWKNVALAVGSALLLVLAFPDFELWFLAWFGLVPLFLALERERESLAGSFVLGWVWGFVFFTGSCWWLTFAPTTYAGFPWPLSYLLLMCVTAVAGIFPGLFAVIFSLLRQRLGALPALFAAPSVWIATEFFRYWLTGNNWNAIGYSQAFANVFLFMAAFGGVAAVGFFTVIFSSSLLVAVELLDKVGAPRRNYVWMCLLFVAPVLLFYLSELIPVEEVLPEFRSSYQRVVAVQPNVPMSGLSPEKWQ